MVTINAPARNWAGNVTFGAQRLHRPASVGELRRIVAGSRQLRVLGSGHSFNLIADTPGDLVRVDGLPPRIDIDAARRRVTIGGGLRYAEVNAALHAAGFALANLASLPHISVAGSCATGTHGSGDSQRGLASAVTALELIGPGGDTVRLDRAADPDVFPGAVVSLGALGVVTALELEIEPSYDVAQWVYENVPLDGLDGARFDALSGAAYSVSTFTRWHDGRGTVVLKRRLDRESAAHPGTGWQGGTLATAPWHPIPGAPTEHSTEQLGVPGPWHERLPHFRPGHRPSHGAELQSELFLPRAAAPEAFAVLRELGELLAPVLQVSEVRTIAADEQWLAPSHGRDSVAFHFTWVLDAQAVVPVVAELEARLLPLGARPHWGKVTTLPPATVTGSYERFADFRRLVLERDPDGVFRNPFVADLLAAA
ncbi:FAD-binding protein [Streptomyces carpaticus]|uniref:FAD-binding protein n=1 Tax=Streptomyces carpaticus TaxID=285558 RepID=UPI00220E0EF8|nr:FAD-binding protein [Streptomyces carpaticus]